MRNRNLVQEVGQQYCTLYQNLKNLNRIAVTYLWITGIFLYQKHRLKNLKMHSLFKTNSTSTYGVLLGVVFQSLPQNLIKSLDFMIDANCCLKLL